MKRIQKIGLIGMMSAMSIGGASVMAGPSQITFTNAWTWGQTNGGGPFEVEPTGFVDAGLQGLGQNGAGAGRFLTFCVERNEHIGAGHTYDAKINTVADNGGISGGHPDPLDSRTAFLYTMFTNGQLDEKLQGSGAGSTFEYGAAQSGQAIQDAIWFIEGELFSIGSAAQDLAALASDAVKPGGSWYGKGIGNVRILNLTVPGSGGSAQDQLVMIPLPVPAALGLAGLLGLVLLSRGRFWSAAA